LRRLNRKAELRHLGLLTDLITWQMATLCVTVCSGAYDSTFILTCRIMAMKFIDHCQRCR
jgi:hypothetical protein